MAWDDDDDDDGGYRNVFSQESSGLYLEDIQGPTIETVAGPGYSLTTDLRW